MKAMLTAQLVRVHVKGGFGEIAYCVPEGRRDDLVCNTSQVRSAPMNWPLIGISLYKYPLC